jgi:hypothetical protein
VGRIVVDTLVEHDAGRALAHRAHARGHLERLVARHHRQLAGPLPLLRVDVAAVEPEHARGAEILHREQHLAVEEAGAGVDDLAVRRGQRVAQGRAEARAAARIELEIAVHDAFGRDRVEAHRRRLQREHRAEVERLLADDLPRLAHARDAVEPIGAGQHQELRRLAARVGRPPERAAHHAG